MERQDILAQVDHTALKPTATWEQIRDVCDEGIRFSTACVCIPACYVRQAKDYVGDRLKLCTVIGFPNGYTTTAAKCFEASDAVENGADEIDMVLNIGWLIAGDYDAVVEEIAAVKQSCAGRVLKVIIETCLLTDEQKIIACRLVSQAGADYIKTSTGFSSGGATASDVALLRRCVDANVKVKAAGGIATLNDAKEFLSLGADRLGTSRVVSIIKQQEGRAYDENLSDSTY